MVQRKDRLESLLHREIATCVAGLTDPRLGMVTITRVEMTGDLHQITAYWTVLGDAKARNLAAHALDHARSFVQRSYGPVVKTRLLPILHFTYDEVQVKRNAMDELIRKARATDPDAGARPEPPAPEPKPEPKPGA
jgi:ribosome-binding factor A